MANYNNSENRALISRAIAREGIILLENKDNILPLSTEKVAVFGRTQVDMIQGGTGSAFCTSEYIIDIITGLENAGIQVDTELAQLYRTWCAENALASFGVWGSGAHVNPEMPLEDNIVAAAADRNDKAIFVIGRTAGENDDVNVMNGDYRLSSEEKAALEVVFKYFKQVILILNSGNLMDMNFTRREEVKAVVLLNLPGMEGGNALGDILSGKFTPSGKLTDTIAYNYTDYPSSKYFGKKGGVIQNYDEDIFVGYRYFETFEAARDKVMYPFGYGLSYTQFAATPISFTADAAQDGMITAKISVQNIGDTYSGKEVIMLYSSAPKSKLGTPAYELRAYQKTRLLAPGEKETLTISFPIADMASYDDTGVLGTTNAWVLMQGDYTISFGNNIRKLQPIGTFTKGADTVLKICTPLTTELRARLTATGEMEALDAIPEDPEKGILLDALEENSIAADRYYKQDEHTFTYRVNVTAPGVYRAKFVADIISDKQTEAEIAATEISSASSITCTLNGRVLDNLAECLREQGDDIILITGTNEFVFTLEEGTDITLTALKLTKNNDPIIIKAEGASYIQGGKYSECGLWVHNSPFTDEEGAIKRGRALTRMHDLGRFALYKLEIEKAGVYDVRLRYCNIHSERKLPEMFTFLISNVGQDVEPVLLERTTEDERYTLTNQRFCTSEPFTLALPKGEAYLKIVSGTSKPAVISYFELTPSTREVFVAEKDSDLQKEVSGIEAAIERYPLAPLSQKYDLRNVLTGEITLDELVNDFTDAELAQITCGNKEFRELIGYLPERGIPGAGWSDGPVGIRQNAKVTVYPSGTMLSSGWNPELAREFGRALGCEAHKYNVDVWLAPAVNIHRNPCCGRNFEYHSEDPYVSGVMAAEIVNGVQEENVAATLKHFAANNTEYLRLRSNSRVSPRAMFEIYMKAFDIVIKRSNPWSIMTSYNFINGIKVCEDPQYCIGVIRNDYGYTGCLMSDFGNDSAHIKELAASHDLKMPFGDVKGVAAALEDGTLDRDGVRICAKRVLELIMRTVVKNIEM